jgi:hypothetical protein
MPSQVLRHDPDTGDEIRRQSKRFTYGVIERPTAAEIEAWNQRVGAEFCA